MSRALRMIFGPKGEEVIRGFTNGIRRRQTKYN
jgi:hypothetical protein